MFSLRNTQIPDDSLQHTAVNESTTLERGTKSRIGTSILAMLTIYTATHATFELDRSSAFHSEDEQEKVINQYYAEVAQELIPDATLKIHCRTEKSFFPDRLRDKLGHGDGNSAGWVYDNGETVNLLPANCDSLERGLGKAIVIKGSYPQIEVTLEDETAEAGSARLHHLTNPGNGQLSFGISEDALAYLENYRRGYHELAHSALDVDHEGCAEVIADLLFRTYLPHRIVDGFDGSSSDSLEHVLSELAVHHEANKPVKYDKSSCHTDMSFLHN